MSELTRDSLPNLSELPESSRAIAWERYQILRPHLEDGVPLRRAIADAGIPLRTAQRWLSKDIQQYYAGHYLMSNAIYVTLPSSMFS